MTTPTENPRVVTPGIETQPDQNQLPPPGIYVGLDWIRCTGPETLHHGLIKWLDEFCETDAKETGKAKWFKRGLVWEPGVMVSWGHRSRVCQVDFQGGRLKLLSGQSRVDLIRKMVDLGMKPTRLDGALDLIEQDCRVCEHAEASCNRGELCLLRRYSPNNEFNDGGTVLRRLLKLGARDSPVCVRIYDKGLEQKAALVGVWERIETEWKKDRAPQVARRLLNAGDGWTTTLTGLILGSIDFRENNGRSEIERRPQIQWWADLIGSSKTARVAPIAQERSFQNWWDWWRSSVAPRLLQFQHESGASLDAILAMLMHGCTEKARRDLVTAGFLDAFHNWRSVTDSLH